MRVLNAERIAKSFRSMTPLWKWNAVADGLSGTTHFLGPGRMWSWSARARTGTLADSSSAAREGKSKWAGSSMNKNG
jgi:hypothetical protein